MSYLDNTAIDNASPEYRQAREALLQAEQDLRRQVAQVAALRQALPLGAAVSEDYKFELLEPGSARAQQTTLSGLFRNPDANLVVYSYMYAEGAAPCPMCTSFLDSFDGTVRHARERLNIVVAAKGPAEQLTAIREDRGWRYLPLASTVNSNYNRDFLAEMPDGSQTPMLNVFSLEDAVVHHRYATELFFSAPEPGQHPRHIDMLFGLWNLFDVTPQGRPSDWFPQIDP